ncbi:hypothetical protein EON66_11480 [archaeon]|nr:MAG: hypothetical protein EON66_11480 [archaeon]
MTARMTGDEHAAAGAEPPQRDGGDNAGGGARQHAEGAACEEDEREAVIRLSAGERQLFMLARLLAQHSWRQAHPVCARLCAHVVPNIICLDEAGSTLDSATDEQLRHTLRTHFPAATMLIVAHRTTTLLECDHVLVLSDGRVIEAGSPAELRTRQGGAFAAMLAAADVAH